MSCKTYSQIMEEIRPYLKGESAADVDAAIKAASAASHEDLVDAYESNRVWAVKMLNRLQPSIGKSPVEIVDMHRLGDGSLRAVYKYPNGDVRSGKFDENMQLSFKNSDNVEYTGFQVMQLFSDRDFIDAGKQNYRELVTDYLNKPEQMVEFAKELGEYEEISDSHKKTLLSAVSELATKLKDYLPKIAVHLNEQAEKTGGFVEFDAGKADVYLSIGPDGNFKSPLEVYAHEMYHAVTNEALNSNDAQLANVKRQVIAIKNEFLDKITPRVLAEYMGGDINDAAKVLNYFANEKVGLHEFVAYAVTNEATIKALQTLRVNEEKETHPDLASKLIALVRELMNWLFGRFDKKPTGNAYEQMQTLVHRIAEANNRQMEVKRNTAMERTFDTLVKADTQLAKYLQKQADKIAKSPMPELKSYSKADVAWYLLKMSARALVDSNAKKALDLVGSSFAGIFKPERTLMTILRDMSESDAYQDVIEKLGLISNNIDQQRHIEFTSVAKTLKDGFTRKLTGKEETMLTSLVLDADYQAIAAETDLNKAMTEDRYVNKKIAAIQDELRSKLSVKDFNFYNMQTDGLARLMMKGSGHIAQYTNTYSMVNARTQGHVDQQLVRDLDRLASFRALELLDVDSKSKIAELYSEQKNGVDLMVAYAAAYNDKARRTIMSSESDNFKMWKGYSKELYDKDVDVQFAPVANTVDMKRAGYKFVKVLERNENDRNSVKMGVFISTLNAVAGLHRVGIRMEGEEHRGSTVTESYMNSAQENMSMAARRDIAHMKNRVLDIFAAQEEGKQGAEAKDFGLVPLLDNRGGILDFRYVMNKDTKVELLGMDRRAINVIGRMYASLYGKSMTKEYNEMMMKTVMADAEKNGVDANHLVGKNNKEYINVNQWSSDEESRDIWRILPTAMKREYPNGIVVRRDMLHSIFGYRDMSIANSEFAKKLPVNIQYGVRVAEYIWKQMVMLAKVNIVIKIPAVLISNVISNLSYSVGTWHSPVKVAQLQLEGVRELNSFLEKSKERVRLTQLIEAGQGNDAMKRKVTALANDLQNSAVRELIDEGFYSTIIEDVDLSEYKNTNKIEKKIKDKFEGYPAPLKVGLNYLFVTSETPIFKALNMATQYSDFVARYAHYHLMLSKGASKAEAAKTVRDVFINYNKPNSRFVEWANQMGLVMFTKYFTRIQKPIKAEFKNHPIRTALELMTHTFVLRGTVDDIFDQSLLMKNYGTIFHGPFENLIQAFSPSGAEALVSTYKHLAK